MLDPEGMGEDELLLLRAPVHAPLYNVVKVAQKRGRPLGSILGLAARLSMVPPAFAHAFTKAHGDYVPDTHDEAALPSLWRTRTGDHAPPRVRRNARFALWYLEQAAFDERFERMWPLIEHAIATFPARRSRR
jgi:hypothetical protein